MFFVDLISAKMAATLPVAASSDTGVTVATRPAGMAELLKVVPCAIDCNPSRFAWGRLTGIAFPAATIPALARGHHYPAELRMWLGQKLHDAPATQFTPTTTGSLEVEVEVGVQDGRSDVGLEIQV